MKIDRLIEETTEKDGVKKWKVVAGIVIGLVLALFLFVVSWNIYILPLVDTYISETNQISALHNFYSTDTADNQNVSVYFVGSSIVMCGVHPGEINRILKEKGYGYITVYNLGINGHYPIERSLLIQNLIDSSPSLVIIGETYSMVNTEGVLEERVFLSQDYLNIREDSLYLYSDNELDIIFGQYNILDYKRFLISAIRYSLSDSSQKIKIESKDLFPGNRLYAEISEYNYQGILNSPNNYRPVVDENRTRAGEAIIYNSKTLTNSNIPVVILNMPLHPLISEVIDNKSRVNFYNLLNETGSLWYDYEFSCPNDEYWYKDGLHIAPYTGAKMFAPQMAELIIELEESNVIHNP